MAKKKYGKYIKKLTFKDEGPGYYRQIAKVNGNAEGVNVQIEYGTYVAAGRIGKEPYGSHVHDFDQVLLWLGTNMNDLSELGAEVELCLGKGEEKEKHIFTGTSAVAIPKGLPHLPATHNRIDKPFIFQKRGFRTVFHFRMVVKIPQPYLTCAFHKERGMALRPPKSG
jgi:hypothetical protein